MKERPILFSAPMIRAIRERQKTQTRRVAKPQPMDGKFPRFCNGEWELYLDRPHTGPYQHIGKCPYGVPGDRLYIKEGVITHASIPQLVGYYMDGCRVTEHWEKRLTAMFMPKRFARTWLEITDVRVQRVQEISSTDSIFEGIRIPDEKPDGNAVFIPRDAYRELWDSINAKKHPWSSNPWVWVLTFKLLGEVRG